MTPPTLLVEPMVAIAWSLVLIAVVLAATVVSQFASLKAAAVQASPAKPSISITGTSTAFPVSDGSCPFSDEQFDRLFRGERFVRRMHQEERAAVAALGNTSTVQAPHLIGRLPRIDPIAYGVPAKLVAVMDSTCCFAVIAGLRACRQVGILTADDELLPELRETTGVVLASSFISMNAAFSEAMRVHEQGSDFEFNRKTLLSLLVTANAQLAALIKAHGPSTVVSHVRLVSLVFQLAPRLSGSCSHWFLHCPSIAHTHAAFLCAPLSSGQHGLLRDFVGHFHRHRSHSSRPLR